MDQPYRAGASRGDERAHCLYCGEPRASHAARCSACGAEPPVVDCDRCGQPVPAPLEACECGAPCAAWLGNAGDLPCPRCGGASLRRVALDANVVGVEQCARCLGTFVRTRDYGELLAREAAGDGVGVARFVPLAPGHELPRQTRLAVVSCPQCGKETDRVRFAGRASLLVDVCAAHGIWLDAGELVALVEFVKKRAGGEDPPDLLGQEEERMWAQVEDRIAAEAVIIGRNTRAAEQRMYFDRHARAGGIGELNKLFGALLTALRDLLP